MNLAAIRLGLHISLGKTRPKFLPACIAATSMLATLLILAVLAAVHVHSATTARQVARSPHVSAGGTLLDEGYLQPDQWHGITVTRILLAATGPDAPLPPGVKHIPGPSEAAVSPRLAQLDRTDPAIMTRFRGRSLTIISPAGLTSPDELIAYEGMPVAVMRALHASTVDGFGDGSGLAQPTGGLGLGAALLFIGFIIVPFAGVCAIVIRLSAAARERRLIALRIMGISPRAVKIIATVEAIIFSLPGCLVGVALFWGLRSIVAGLRIGGGQHFEADIRVSAPLTATVVVLLAAIDLVSGWAAGGRVSTIPATSRPVIRAKRLRRSTMVPLASAAAILAIAAVMAKTNKGTGVNKLLDLATVLTIGGLAIGLPSLMQSVAGLSLRSQRLPVPLLLAARRLHNDPGTVTRLCSVFSAMVFAIGFATGLSTAFHLNISSARTDLTYGHRTLSTVDSSFLPIDVISLQKAAPTATVIPEATLTASTGGSAGSMLTGTCAQLERISATSVACPSSPVILSTSTGVTGAPFTPGTSVHTATTSGQLIHFSWPALSIRIDAPAAANLDGTLWVPTSNTSLAEIAQVRADSAIAVIAPTGAARDALRASVALVAPSAVVQFPGEGEIESAHSYASYGDVVIVAAAMACLIGLFGLLATAIASTRTRAHSLVALRAIGVPQGQLRLSSAIETASSIGLASLLALAAAASAASSYLHNQQLPEPLFRFEVLAAATVAVAILLVGCVTIATTKQSQLGALRSE